MPAGREPVTISLNLYEGRNSNAGVQLGRSASSRSGGPCPARCRGGAYHHLRQTIFAGHALSGRHSHPEEQVTIVLEGKARFACEDDETTLGPGGVVVFPPDKEHSTENVGDGDLVLEEVFSPGPDRLNKLAPERPQ